MSKSLPESRASSSGASSPAKNVDNLPADDVEEDNADQQIPVDDSSTDHPETADTDNRQDDLQEDLQVEHGGDQQVPAVDDSAVEQPNDDVKNEEEATEQVLVQIVDVGK